MANTDTSVRRATARRLRAIHAASGLLLSMVALSGCKKEVENREPYKPPPRRASYMDQYKDLCAPKPSPFDGAKAYEKGKTPDAVSKTVVLMQYLDDKSPSYRLDHNAALEPFLAKNGEMDAVELVACVDLKRHEPPAYCTYIGGKVLIYDMTYTLRLLEAKTGKEVVKDEFTIDRKTKTCPSTYAFEVGKTTVFEGPDFGPKLLSHLLPLQPEGTPLPPVKRWSLRAVCSGSPVPQAPAYDPSEGRTRRVQTVFFADDAQGFSSNNLPDGFSRKDDAEEADVSKFELVACVTGKPKVTKRKCNFLGGEVLELSEGEFEVRLLEARTGKVVETKSFKGTSPAGCPLTHKFWGNREQRMTKIEPAFGKYIAALEGSKP